MFLPHRPSCTQVVENGKEYLFLSLEDRPTEWKFVFDLCPVHDFECMEVDCPSMHVLPVNIRARGACWRVTKHGVFILEHALRQKVPLTKKLYKAISDYFELDLTANAKGSLDRDSYVTAVVEMVFPDMDEVEKAVLLSKLYDKSTDSTEVTFDDLGLEAIQCLDDETRKTHFKQVQQETVCRHTTDKYETANWTATSARYRRLAQTVDMFLKIWRSCTPNYDRHRDPRYRHLIMHPVGNCFLALRSTIYWSLVRGLIWGP